MIPSFGQVRRGAAAAVGCLLAAGVLAVVPSVATPRAAALDAGESVLVVALGSSLSDVGTAASLVAGGQGDAVVLAEATDGLGAGAASIIAEQLPDRIVVVGGAGAVGHSVADELRGLSPGVEIDRLAGSDRIHTAAMAAARALRGSESVTVVLANGWSLPDVGAAASAVASGAADAVLYSGRTALGEPTRQVLAGHRPVRMLVAGGEAAVSHDVLESATAAAGVVQTERLGGTTRVETAARVAQRALGAGATTAVLANGWSLSDVGIAAGLAAALPNSVVLYTESGSLGAATEATLLGHSVDHVFLVGAVDAATTQLLADIGTELGVTQITEASQASLHALGAAAPASQSEPDGASSLAPRLSSDAAPVVGVGTAFEVDVRFPRAVSGLEVDDFDIVNGDATALSGSGVSYRLTVVAKSPGTVVVRVPERAAHDRLGYGNEKSQPVAVTVTDGGADSGLGIDTWDRDAVLAAYEVEYEREEPEWGYTGDVANCVAGTTSQEFRDSVIQRVNWFRRMAGLTTVTENASFSSAAQHAALMMAAQGSLSHYPDDDWRCYSETGAMGARSSNLFLGVSGLPAIDGYIRDPGAGNVSVGHRTWILLPQQATVGTGDVPNMRGAHRAANALYVLGPRSSTREVRQPRGFVAWPPSGYVPYTSVWGRWSFGLAALESQCGQPALWQCRPDVSGATVAMADESGPVDIEIIARGELLTEATIVWAVEGDTNSAVRAKPDDAEHCYTVTISGIRVEGTVEDPYEYMTCVFDPDAAG